MSGARHPSDHRLERYADGDLPPWFRPFLRRHLARCARCRRRVAEVRALGEALRELPVPGPGPHLRERVRASWREGGGGRLSDDVLDPPNPSVLRYRLPAAAAALVAAGLLLTVLLSVPAAEAARSELTFTPSTPTAGERVELSYRAEPRLRGEDRLHARVELYDPDGVRETRMVPLDLRPGAGLYGGELALPEWAVYAVLAVEDTTGAVVDANAGALWDVVARDGEGRPSLEGLRHRMGRHATTRLHLAFEAAQSMVEHHPDRPEGWNARFALERLTVGPGGLEALRARHRPLLEELERRLESDPPSRDEHQFMFLYASGVGDESRREAWAARLFDEAPDSRVAVQLRVGEAQMEYGENPPRLLEVLEELWAEVGPNRDVAVRAFSVAELAGDGDALRRWAHRREGLEQGTEGRVAVALSSLPATREEGMARLRRELDRLERSDGTELRPLDVSVSQHRRMEEERRRELLAALGEALVESGELRAGLDTLRLASDVGWEAAVFRTVARVLTSRGDAEEALPYLAGVAVDPETGSDERARIEEMAASHISPAEWESKLSGAERLMQDRVLEASLSRRLPQEIRLEDEAGRTVDLAAGLPGRVSVVSFWYCLCEPVRGWLENHASLVRELEERGVPVHTVVSRTPALDVPRIPRNEVAVPEVLRDADDEALRAFGYAQTPAYFVVDHEGAVRFEYSSPEEIRRQVAALEGRMSAPVVVQE